MIKRSKRILQLNGVINDIETLIQIGQLLDKIAPILCAYDMKSYACSAKLKL